MHTTQPPSQFNPLLPPQPPSSYVQSRRTLYCSDEERQILEKAASILAVSVKDLPTSLQDFQPSLTIQTSVSGDKYATSIANGYGVAGEELVRPFSWHSGAVHSSQWSPVAASRVSPTERLNNGPSNIDMVGPTGLYGDSALFGQAPALGEATSWGHVTDQSLGIANIEDDLVGHLSSEEIAEIAGQQTAKAMAWPQMQYGMPLHGASMDLSASLLHREPTIQPGSSAPCLSEPFDASFLTTHPMLALTPGSYHIQPSDLLETSPYHDQPGLRDGQGFGWPFSPTDIWYKETGNPWLADPDLDLNLSSHRVDIDDDSYHVLSLDQTLQQGLDATDSGAPSTFQGHLSDPAAHMRAFSDITLPNNIAVEDQTGLSPETDDETRIGRVQSSDNPTNQQVPSKNISRARARFHGPLPTHDHQPKRRQPFEDLRKRIETGEMRKLGACVRCRMQRLRCSSNDNPDRPCIKCQVLSKPTLANLPCVRYKIRDSRLSDKGQHPQFKWSRRWPSWKMVEIEQWRSPEIKVITITQDVFGGSTFDIACREFIPIEGDSLQRTWKKKGITQYFPRAPYAIANMKETGDAIKRFVVTNNGSLIKHFIEVTNDELLRSTYAMAHAMVFRPLQFTQNEEARELLQEVFQIWVAIRMESQSERICGRETLGMKPQFLDRDVNTFGTNSIPPIMSAQIELITTTRMLQPLKRSILRKLQNLIKANKLENWFPTYLCLFILLHSCSILTNDEYRRARKYGLETRYVYNIFVEELHMGAKTMIYHFHYCNKGSYPFTKEWVSTDHIELARLNQEQVNFLLKTAEEVQRRRSEFESLAKSDDYENDFYFLAQLYDTDWRPTYTV